MPVNPLERQKNLQKANPPVEQKNAYQELYRLRENPFPSMALFTPNINDPRRNGEIYDAEFRKEEEKEFFKMFIQPDNGDRPTQLGFIRLDPQAGGRGNGKSAFLHRIMQRINGQDWEVEWVTNADDPNLFCLGVHVLPEPKKQKRIWEFARLVFETMNEKNVFEKGEERSLFEEIERQLRAAVMVNMLTQEQLNELSSLSEDEINKSLSNAEEFSALLAKYGHTIPGYVDMVKSQVEKIQPDSNLFLGDLVANEYSLTATWREWSTNGMLGSDYKWRKEGVDWLTNGLVPVMLVAGYRRLIILLDEFEKIYISQNGRERDEFLDGLRQYLFERDSVAVKHQYITTVLTIHPSIYSYVDTNWRRVGLDNLAPLDVDRIQNVSVELGASDEAKLEHLLVSYLDFFRVNTDDPKKGSIYPFNDDALAPAINEARFYPRGTLWYANKLLHKAAEENVPAPISREFVEEFIQGGVKPPQEDDDVFFNLPPAASDLTA